MTLLAEIINETVKRGGNIIIPAFAVGRTQTMIYYLHALLKAGKIPDLPVYIDSPLAISATDIFMHNPQDFDGEAYDMLYNQKDNPLRLPHLIFSKTAEESKKLMILRARQLLFLPVVWLTQDVFFIISNIICGVLRPVFCWWGIRHRGAWGVG